MSDSSLNSGGLLSSLTNSNRPARTSTSMTNSSSSNSIALPGTLSAAQKQALNREFINNQTKQTNLLNSSAAITQLMNQNQSNTSQISSSVLRQIGAIDAAANRITSAITTQTNQLVTSINNMSNAITDSIHSLKEGIDHLFYERVSAYSDKVMNEETQKDYDRYAKDFIKTFFSEKFWGAISSIELVSLSKVKEQTIKYLMQNKQFANFLGIMPYGDKRFDKTKMVPFTKDIADAIKDSAKTLGDIANTTQNISENQSNITKFFGDEYLERSNRLINVNTEILAVMTRVANIVLQFKDLYQDINEERVHDLSTELHNRLQVFQNYIAQLGNFNGGANQQNVATLVQQLIAARRQAQDIEDAYASRIENAEFIESFNTRQPEILQEIRRLHQLINNPQPGQNTQALVQQQLQLAADLNASRQQVQALTQASIHIPTNITREQNLRQIEEYNNAIHDLQLIAQRGLNAAQAESAIQQLIDRFDTNTRYRGRVSHHRTGENTEARQNRNDRISNLITTLNNNTRALKESTKSVEKSITAMDIVKTSIKAAINPFNIWKVISTGSRWVLKFMAPYMLYTMLFKMGANTLMGNNWGGQLLHGLIKWPFQLIGGIGTGGGKTVGDHVSGWLGSAKDFLVGFYNRHISGIWEGIGNKLESFKEMFKNWIGDKWWKIITDTITGIKKYTKLAWDAFLNPNEENARAARKELYRPFYEFFVEAIQKYLIPVVMWGSVAYTGIKNLANPSKFLMDLSAPIRGAYNTIRNSGNRLVSRYIAASDALDRSARGVLAGSRILPRNANNVRLINNNNGTYTIRYDAGGDGIFSRAWYNARRGQGGNLLTRIFRGSQVTAQLTQDQINNIEGDAIRELMDKDPNLSEEDARGDIRPLSSLSGNATLRERIRYYTKKGARGIASLWRGGARFIGAIGELASATLRTVSWFANIGSTLYTIGLAYKKYESWFKKAEQESTDEETGQVDRGSYIQNILKTAKTALIDPMLNNIKEGLNVVWDVLPEVGTKVVSSIWDWVKTEGPTILRRSWILMKNLGSLLIKGFGYIISWAVDKIKSIFGKDKGSKLEDKLAENSANKISDEEFKSVEKQYKTGYDNTKKRIGALTSSGEKTSGLGPVLFNRLVSIADEALFTYGHDNVTTTDLETYFNKHTNIAGKEKLKSLLYENPGIVRNAEEIARLKKSLNYNGLGAFNKENYARYQEYNRLAEVLGGDDNFGIDLLLTDPSKGILKINNVLEAFKYVDELNQSSLASFLDEATMKIRSANDDAEKAAIARQIATEYNNKRILFMKDIGKGYQYSHPNIDNETTTKNLADMWIEIHARYANAFAEVTKQLPKINTNMNDVVRSNDLLAKINNETAEREEAFAAENGGLSLGVVAQWVQSGKFKNMITTAFEYIGDKFNALISFFKKQDYSKLFSDTMSGLGSASGAIMSALFGAEKADNFSRAAYSYASRRKLKYATAFFGGARKSILMSVENIAEHAAKTGQTVQEIRDILNNQGIDISKQPPGSVVLPEGNSHEKYMVKSVLGGISSSVWKDEQGIALGKKVDDDTAFRIALARTFKAEGDGINPNEDSYKGIIKGKFQTRRGTYAIDLPSINDPRIKKILTENNLGHLIGKSGIEIYNNYRKDIAALNAVQQKMESNEYANAITEHTKNGYWKTLGLDELNFIPQISGAILDTRYWMGPGGNAKVIRAAIKDSFNETIPINFKNPDASVKRALFKYKPRIEQNELAFAARIITAQYNRIKSIYDSKPGTEEEKRKKWGGWLKRPWETASALGIPYTGTIALDASSYRKGHYTGPGVSSNESFLSRLSDLTKDKGFNYLSKLSSIEDSNYKKLIDGIDENYTKKLTLFSSPKNSRTISEGTKLLSQLENNPTLKLDKKKIELLERFGALMEENKTALNDFANANTTIAYNTFNNTSDVIYRILQTVPQAAKHKKPDVKTPKKSVQESQQ